MKIPALRAKLGNWEYYVTTLTFAQVSGFVSKIDSELYKSENLRDLIQRSITSNFKNIKDYILSQPEMFFNSLVLAVYDDYPRWREIEFKYGDTETYQMGLLEFPGNHKIFPVDGQHRVEGIKAALEANPELQNERIAAIFIGHKSDGKGKQRTRRLFTTLNRYAKPVSLNDIIALDEDDVAAIITRDLLEDFDLFSNGRIANAKHKAVSASDKQAITSIITLYHANVELLFAFLETTKKTRIAREQRVKYLKVRPNEKELSGILNFCVEFWTAFKTELPIIEEYLKIKENPALKFRDHAKGGNLIFRPIGFLPFIKAALLIKKTKGTPFSQILKKFSKMSFELNEKPWSQVAWDPIQQRMRTNVSQLIQMLLIFWYDKKLLTDRELHKLEKSYAAQISFAGKNLKKVLDNIF